MTDLDVIAAMRPEVPLPTSEELREARRRLEEAIMNEWNAPGLTVEGRRATPEASVHSRKARPLVRIALVGAAAAIATALAVLFIAPSAQIPGRTSDNGRVVINLAAARFLDRAAAAALSQSAITPLPNQYVYSETEGPDGTFTETWLSVDGASPGLSRSTGDASGAGGTNLSGCTIAQAETKGCFPEAGYFPDMPNDPNEILAYLNKIGVVDTGNQTYDSMPGWEDNDVAKAVMYLMQTSYLLPTQQAALYSLMAQTPGFQIVPDMKDAIGRTGVGIEWNFEGGTGVIIFDPATYSYLGARTWQGAPTAGGPYDGAALVKVAIVGSAGATP